MIFSRTFPLLSIASLALAGLGAHHAEAVALRYDGDGPEWSEPMWWEGGIAPGFNTTILDTRINVNADPGLVYDASLGTTILDVSTTGGENRALSIGLVEDGANARFTITGGTLQVLQEGSTAGVLVGGGNGTGWYGTAYFTISGGNLEIPEGEMGMMIRGDSGLSVFTLSGGTATMDRLTFGEVAKNSGTGIVNLTGGVLTTRAIYDRNDVANSIINFDGGTLRAGDKDNNEEWIKAQSGGVTVNILAGGANFDTNGQHGQRINVAMSGTGNLRKIGEGTLALQQNNTYAGTTTVSAGTLMIGYDGTTGSIGTGTLNVAAGATLMIGRRENLTQSAFAGSGISGGYAGPGNFGKRFGGVFTMDIANTYTGTTDVQGGVLLLKHASALGSTAGSSIVQTGAAIALSNTKVTGEGLTILGDGGSTLDTEVLVASRGALQSSSGVSEWTGNITVGATNARVGVQEGAQLTLSGTISDGGAGHTMVFRGGNLLDDGSMITISGTGNQWGRTEMYGNTIRIGGNNVLPTAATLSVGISSAAILATTFDLNGFNQEVAGITQNSSAPSFITNRGAQDAVLTLGGVTDRSYWGVLQDGATNKLSVQKQGSFVQTLTGASTYTGATTVSEGALIISGSISGSDVTVSGGRLGGAGTIAPGAGNSVTFLAGGKLSPGSGLGTLKANFSAGGAFDISTGVAAVNSQALLFELGAPGISDLVLLTGGALEIGTGVLAFDDFSFTTLTGFGEGTYTLFDSASGIVGSLDPNLANLTGSIGALFGTVGFSDSGDALQLTVVPEPGTAGLLLGGLGVLLGMRRRRRA